MLNRRGYHGSTPLSESETNVDLATSRTDFYKNFLQSRAEEVAKFLVKLIEIEGIPVKVETPGRASGGIALLGWSLGNVFTVSLLALANNFDPAIQTRLQPYLRKLIILGMLHLSNYSVVFHTVSSDAPYHAWGYPPEKDVYDPYYDPTIPDAQREQIFAGWVSSYYTHSSGPLDPKASLMQGLEQKHPNPAKPNTMSRFTPSEFSTIIEQTTNAHGDHFVLLDQHRHVHRENLYKVLFGNRNEPNAVEAFPDVNISYIWCTEAHWHPILGMRLVKADVESPPTGLHLQRKIKFVALEGGNHYVSLYLFMNFKHN